MEKLTLHYERTQNALALLEREIDFLASGSEDSKKYYHEFRTAAIKAFECSVEELHKTLKQYLLDKYNTSPNRIGEVNAIYRAAL